MFIASLASGFVEVAALSYWIAPLISGKVFVGRRNGYTASVYSGCSSRLLIENELQDTGLTKHILHGNLPDGSPVTAYISPWDGSADVVVGKALMRCSKHYKNNDGLA